MTNRYRSLMVILAVVCSPVHKGLADEPTAQTTAAAQTPSPKEPEWLLLRIDAVRVAAQRPGSAGTWDGPEAQSSGAGCKLLELVAGAGVAGAAASLMCHVMTDKNRQVQQDPKSPDLLIKLTAGAQTIYRTYIAQDTHSHVFLYSLVLPVGAIPRGGLQLLAVDQDGDDIGDGELIGSVRLSRAQLMDAALGASPVMTLSDGPLEKLELLVEPYAASPRKIAYTHRANEKLTPVPELSIHAGEIVELRAAGSYSVASGSKPALLGPAGYQDGSRRGYNLPDLGFTNIAHGAAVARVGGRGTQANLAVAGCVVLTSPFTGGLELGLNDSDVENNRGELQFDVVVRPPRSEEWSRPGFFTLCDAGQERAPKPQLENADAAL